jgi:hypothetical protein
VEAFSNIFTTDTKSWSIPDWGSSNMCDMYMCRLRHINDPVLSSLKMEGIRLLLCNSCNRITVEMNLCSFRSVCFALLYILTCSKIV